MLFVYELKKIWRRVSPLAVLIVILVTSVLTVSLTAFLFNKAPAAALTDVSAKYTNLTNQINNWNDALNRESFTDAFNNFYTDYKTMNASTFHGGADLVTNYEKAKTSFNKFFTEHYQYYINNNEASITNYLLVQKKHVSLLDDIITKLDTFFQAGFVTPEGIIQGLEHTNTAWEDEHLETILNDLFYVQTINKDDLTALRDFLANYPAGQEDFDYTDAYEYGINKYWIAVEAASEYSGHLSDYEGFTGYENETVSQQACKLASYRLANPDQDFVSPYKFGNIHNQAGEQVSLFDFVFTNMEMAMIMVAVLVTIWAASVFFTDSYQNTLITPITAGKKRSMIILSKMAVVMLLTFTTILVFTGVYITAGLIIFDAYLSPDILFLLNGTFTTTMSSINYYVIYALSLVFKMLPLIAICGLLSFSNAKPFLIMILTALIYAIVVTLNLCLSNFAFYEYVPFLGLNPINYCGAEPLLSTMPNTYNILYTFPAMFTITVLLYLWLIQKFRRHDFY